MYYWRKRIIRTEAGRGFFIFSGCTAALTRLKEGRNLEQAGGIRGEMAREMQRRRGEQWRGQGVENGGKYRYTGRDSGNGG